jgi:hypothetical protein
MPEITQSGTTIVTLSTPDHFPKQAYMAYWWQLSDSARVLLLHNYYYCSQCDIERKRAMCVHIYIVILKGGLPV